MAHRVVHIHVGEDGHQGWRILMSDAGAAPAEVRVPSSRVAEIQARCEAAAAPSAVIVPGHDLSMVRRERAAGQALASALAASPVAELWQRALGEAGSQGPILAVSAELPEVSALPWELLATAPQEDLLEGCGGVVVRLARGEAPPDAAEVHHQVRLLVWCPTPDDPVCRRDLDALRELTQRLEQPAPVTVTPGWAPLPDEEPGVLDVLHIIGHGAPLEELVALELEADRPVAPGAAVGLVRAALSRFGLVLFDVCSGGDLRFSAFGSLAGQALLQGARAVIAPVRPVMLDASVSFSEGLYGAIARGEPVTRAVHAGRARVRALGLAHPSGRASNLLLFVSRLGVLDRPLIRPASWRPEGWPSPDQALGDLLIRARGLASRDRQGHVGLEHLVRAGLPSDGGPLSQHLGHLVRGAVGEPVWANLSPPPWCDVEPTPTPRVRRLLAGLTGPATIDDLWRALLEDIHHGLHPLLNGMLILEAQLVGRGPQTPIMGGESPVTAGPAAGFEVLWGPWDGRRISPAPGDTLGRGDQDDGPDHPLSAPDAPWADGRISRRHLRYVGVGQLHAASAVTHFPGGRLERPERREGAFAIMAGDLIKLGARTWLRAIS